MKIAPLLLAAVMFAVADAGAAEVASAKIRRADYPFFNPPMSAPLRTGLGAARLSGGASLDSAAWQNLVRELAPGRLGTIRAYSKAHNATVNDVLLAAWYRAIYRLAQPPVGAHLAVMTHLNLRRRLPKRQAGAIANLSQIAFTSIGTELGATLADTVLRVHAEMERIKDTPPMLGRMLPMSRRQMQRRMARLPRPPRFGPGVPMFNNIGQIDPARLRLGVPAENAYLTACLGREGDTSLQVVITTCGAHVNLAVVTRDIHNNREILAALLDAFEEELAATA